MCLVFVLRDRAKVRNGVRFLGGTNFKVLIPNMLYIRPNISEILDQMQVGYDKRVRPDYGGEANNSSTH